MTSFKILNEAISKLYHFTRLDRALMILKTGELMLTPAVKPAEQELHRDVGINHFKGSFFLSTTRTITGSYHNMSRTGVLFDIDGRELNLHGKVRPVMYFDGEYEDRLISNKSEISISGVITGVRILVPKTVADGAYVDPSDLQISLIRKITIEAKKRGLPVTFHSETGKLPWANSKNSTTVIPELIKKKLDVETPHRKYIKPRDPNKPNFINMLKFLITTTLEYDELPPQAKTFMSKHLYYKNDVSLINAELHNAIQDMMGYSSNKISPIHALQKAMIKNKLKNGTDIFDFIKQKFSKK